jgi:tetrahydromethanopterin S-methyltransferase subunit G
MIGCMKQKGTEKMPSWAGVWIEHFDAKVNLLIDGYAMLDKKIDEKIDGLRAEMNQRFAMVDERFTEVDARFNHIDARFNEIDVRFATIDEKFEVVFEVLDDIKKEMKSVKI